MKVSLAIFNILITVALGGMEYSNLTEFTLKNLDTFIEDDFKTNSSCFPEDREDTGLLGLIEFITATYLRNCVNVILYDQKFEEESSKLNFNLKDLLMNYPGDYVNGQVSVNATINDEFLMPQKNKCTDYLLFVPDLTWATKLVGPQTVSKVVVVTLSTRWKIEEYLQKSESRKIVNLLIVSHVTKQDIFFGLEERSTLSQYTNLYTHNLLTDAVGSNVVQFLTSWWCGKLIRNVNLFPPKMNKGFNGKQFVIAASEQPPFTFKKRLNLDEDSNDSQLWDGVEIRLLRLLADFLNYTLEIKEPKMLISRSNGPSETVISEILRGVADIGSAGVYVTNQRLSEISLSAQHSTDCAAFITKATTSLPRYRAILGPFQLSVWITLTITYLIAIVPLTFTDSHSLKPLIKNPWLIEDMFWHVFGTFTNLFTFTESKSWTKSKKNASRLLVGWYWAFSIIVTACYTGSIVSFITLFIFPDVIDHVDQLVKMNFRIGTLSTAGWDTWFNNSDHEKTKWLLRDIEVVPNTTQGLKNVSNSFYLPMFRPYAFLASRAQMEYIVQANYTTSKRREKMHITKDCFVPFGVSYVFPNRAVYADKFNEYIIRVQQSGLMGKLLNEFKWEVERTSTGKLLQAGSGRSLREVVPLQRKLTLDDTQGIYLLLGAGYLIALTALLGEIIHAQCKKKKKVSAVSGSPKKSLFKFGKLENYKQNTLRVTRFFLKRFNNSDTTLDFDYDDATYKKFDGKVSRPHNSNNSVVHKGAPYSSREFMNCSFEEKIEQGKYSLPDLRHANEEAINRDESSEINKSIIYDSINSLPWEWGRDLHLRRNCDAERHHTS